MIRKYIRIFIREKWTDEWQLSPHLEAISADVCCLPTIGTAKFIWRLGKGQLEDKTPLIPVGDVGRFWPWYYIQIRCADNAEFDHESIYWTGFVPVEQFFLLGDKPVKSADVEIQAYEIVKLLDVPLTFSYCTDEINGTSAAPIKIEGLERFNKRYHLEGRLVGNRSDVKYQDPDAEEGSLVESYVFSSKGEVWTNADIIEYLITWYQPICGPLFSIDWMCDNYPEIWDALDDVKAVYDLEGCSLLQAINELIPRNRGLCWRCEAVTEDQNKIEIIASSLLDQPFKIYDTTLPENTDKIPADIWTHNGDREVKVTIDSRGKYDKITVRGSKMKTCFTASLASGGGFEKAWTDTLETAYKNGAKDVEGYDEQSEDDQKIWNDRYRGTDRFKRVYTTFRIKKDYNWQIPVIDPETEEIISYDMAMPKLDPKTGDFITPKENAAFWPIGKKILDYLPFKVGTDYSTGVDPIDENPEDSEPEYRRIFAIVKKTDGTGFPAEKLASESGIMSATVRPLQREMGVEIRFSPAYLAAKNHFDGAEPGQHDLEEDETIGCDYLDTKVTIFVETDQYVKFEHLLVSDEGLIKSEMVIDVPTAELWYIVPGTTVDIAADGSELVHYSTSDNILRDDRDLLKAIITAAAAWYSFEQYQVSIVAEEIGDDVWLGDMLIDIDVTGNWVDIGSCITHIGWDFKNQTTLIETDFCELNFAAIATGRRKAAGERTPGLSADKQISTLKNELEKIKEQISTIPQRFEIPFSKGGGTNLVELGQVITTLQYADPASFDINDGVAYYGIRLLNDSTQTYDTTGQTTYHQNDVVIDPITTSPAGGDNRKYKCTAASSLNERPSATPAKWEKQDEDILIEHALGNEDKDLRLFVPWFDVNALVPITSRQVDIGGGQTEKRYFIWAALTYSGDHTQASIRWNETQKRAMACFK